MLAAVSGLLQHLLTRPGTGERWKEREREMERAGEQAFETAPTFEYFQLIALSNIYIQVL